MFFIDKYCVPVYKYISTNFHTKRGWIMKTLKRLAVALLLLFTLSACDPTLLVVGGTLLGGGLTYLAMDHNANKSEKSKGDAVLASQKQSWIEQCLLIDTHTPQWCKQRADKAFPEKNETATAAK
jgi:hypothetical protein